MAQVTIYTLKDGEDVTAGVLRLIGGAVVADPPDSVMLTNLLKTPLFDREERKHVTATSNPERWLPCLTNQ